MRCWLPSIAIGVSLLWAGDTVRFRLQGRIGTETPAAVTLNGSTTPFTTSTLSDGGGRFDIRNLEAGTYTVSVFIPNRGEIRRTIEVGPGTADGKGTVSVSFDAGEAKPVRDSPHKVSASELAIPDKARKLYADAQKRLEKRDVEGAIEKLDEAVKLAPQFVTAWNNLGTIFYQTQQYPRAEQVFRKALEQDPSAYEPLVNLGGVLLTLRRPEEALQFNLYSVLSRPEDALANAQLGMNYFMLGQLELAKKYLLEAQRLDPAHFSHPQLLLAEIYVRLGYKDSAADELESFLRWHPDSPKRDGILKAIEKLR
jgi:Tfp pilus assembly protein PilF